MALTVVGRRDRRCPGWTLDNWLRRWWAPAQAEVDRLAVAPGHHVVDLGAGVGYLTPALLGRVGPAGRVELVEPDVRNLSVAEARWGKDPRVRLLLSSATAVPTVPPESADRVFLSLVLCCLVDKAGALDEAWRILRPGGLLLVSYPDRGRRWNPQKQSLRVPAELWDVLLAQHPWRVLSSERSWFIRRHLLEKHSPGV